MRTVVKIVPIVSVHWEDIGYRLRLDYQHMCNLETEVTKSGDKRSACRQVMKTWISSTRGKGQKTWKDFVMVLHDLSINCDTVIELLQDELV